MKIQLTKKASQKIRKKNPLIQPEDLQTRISDIPKEYLTFSDERGEILGTGYLGKQNKGIGWLISYEALKINKTFLHELFQTAVTKRKKFFQNNETTAFRLFNGEGDGFGGITIDYYAGYLVISWYNETIYALKEELLLTISEVLSDNLGIVEKIRFQSDLPESNWYIGEKPAEPWLVKENGINYATYLDEGYMTGIFLDQKEVRKRLASGLAKEKKVLNMFSYTGAFSVAAAVGGAAGTTSVDLAKRSLDKTREQFEVNQISLEKQKIVVMDTFEYFKYAKRKGFSYDLIILDPPSFARNKKKTFSVAKDYGRLIAESLEILNPKGQIIASTNASNLTLKKFRQSIEKSLDEQGVTYQLKETFRLPQDFPVAAFEESNYLKVLFYEIKK